MKASFERKNGILTLVVQPETQNDFTMMSEFTIGEMNASVNKSKLRCINLDMSRSVKTQVPQRLEFGWMEFLSDDILQGQLGFTKVNDIINSKIYYTKMTHFLCGVGCFKLYPFKQGYTFEYDGSKNRYVIFDANGDEVKDYKIVKTFQDLKRIL